MFAVSLTSLRTFALFIVFFFNDTATTEIYTLSLHDALPISGAVFRPWQRVQSRPRVKHVPTEQTRSEEHTSELQSRQYLVCRLLLEKKNKLKGEQVALVTDSLVA